MPFPEVLELLVGFAAIALLGHIGWHDFWNLTIRNGAVLVLLGLYGLWAALTGFSSLAGDLAAGAVLFLPGFIMWLLRLMGAGDVKLYFALGLFIGLDGLWLFAILLLAVSVVFLIALQVIRLTRSSAGVMTRLHDIRSSGKAPYAVIMALAAIPVIVLRLYTQT